MKKEKKNGKEKISGLSIKEFGEKEKVKEKYGKNSKKPQNNQGQIHLIIK